jgi:predicted DNA-binding transcriptional regulator AlpA
VPKYPFLEPKEGGKEMAQNTDQTNRLIFNEYEIAEMLGVSVRTLQMRRMRQLDPPYYKVGKSVRYRLDDVTAWLENQRVEPGRESA